MKSNERGNEREPSGTSQQTGLGILGVNPTTGMLLHHQSFERSGSDVRAFRDND